MDNPRSMTPPRTDAVRHDGRAADPRITFLSKPKRSLASGSCLLTRPGRALAGRCGLSRDPDPGRFLRMPAFRSTGRLQSSSLGRAARRPGRRGGNGIEERRGPALAPRQDCRRAAPHGRLDRIAALRARIPCAVPNARPAHNSPIRPGTKRRRQCPFHEPPSGKR